MKSWLGAVMVLVIGCGAAAWATAPEAPGKTVVARSYRSLDMPDPEPGVLRVLELNIWQEGTSVPGGFDKIVNVILASKAQVVALAEVRNYHHTDLHQRLIAALRAKGQTFYGEFRHSDVGLLSRYPIEAVDTVDDRTRRDCGSIIAYHIKLPGGQQLVACAAHLDYHNYGLYAPRGYSASSFKLVDNNHDGKPDPELDVPKVLEADRKSERRAEIAAFLDYVKKQNPGQTAVILAGDFNEGSHLDWTAATAELFDHHGAIVPWDDSITLAKAGFVDSWRQLFPNPATHPGMTWPSVVCSGKRTTWAPLADERDRVDFVYYNKVGLQAERAWLVGPRGYWILNKPQEPATSDPFALSDLPWPTDHKGVLVDFAVKPRGSE